MKERARRNLIAELPEADLDDQASSEERAVELATLVFRRMMEAGGQLYTKELRDELADRLLDEPLAKVLMLRIVRDVDFSRRAFGNMQAEARYFAVVTLKRSAELGDESSLTDAAQDVAQELATARGVDRGRAEDLRSLISAYMEIRQIEPMTFEELRKLGYHPEMPSGLKELYADAVFQVLWHRNGLISARSQVESLLSPM